VGNKKYNKINKNRIKMKIKQITIALFFGVLATMSAQDKGTLKSGIKGGYNLAAVSFDRRRNRTAKRHAGVYGESH
jgi:hypothetical protein